MGRRRGPDKGLIQDVRVKRVIRREAAKTDIIGRVNFATRHEAAFEAEDIRILRGLALECQEAGLQYCAERAWLSVKILEAR